MISAQHQQPQHLNRTTHHMTDTISQTQQANSSSVAGSPVAKNADINARRDAASMMMSMSHLMDAAAVHAQQQQQRNSATATNSIMVGNRVSRLPAVQSIISSTHNQIHPHHNHTNRGPHKKRTASAASLDDSHSNTRSGTHLSNRGGGLRLTMTGASNTPTVASSASSTLSSTTNTGGKSKVTSASALSINETSNGNPSTSNGPLTEEEKKAERRAANRRSAFQSRQRRKILIEDLQRTVAALSKDNNDLRKSNDEIRSQLEAALLENRQLRQITSSLSAQAHAQQAQVAAQQAQQQHQQQAATVSQQQSTGSPTISAQQTPPPVPSVSQQQQSQAVAVTPAAPPSFSPQTLSSSTAALNNFLTNFSSQAATSAASTEQQQHIFNAKIALMAVQSRVSELEHHQAAQAQAAANAAVVQQQHQAQLQVQAQAAASAALGLAHVQAPAPGNSALSDAQHLARLQELLARGISNASATATTSVSTAPPVAPPVGTIASTNSGAPTNTGSISAAGVDLSHLRSLLEAQQQRQVAGTTQTSAPISTAPESPGRAIAHEQVVTSSAGLKVQEAATDTRDRTNSITSETATNAGTTATVTIASQAPSSIASVSKTPSSTSTACPSTLSSTAGQDAPGIQLLIESLRAGQNGAAGNSSAPPLDEAVRNYIKQQQMAQQQQASNTVTAIKTESS